MEWEELEYQLVELHRGSRGFGFSIRGGQEFNGMPLYVLRIAEGGAADQFAHPGPQGAFAWRWWQPQHRSQRR